jgi:hypothetical protein
MGYFNGVWCGTTWTFHPFTHERLARDLLVHLKFYFSSDSPTEGLCLGYSLSHAKSVDFYRRYSADIRDEETMAKLIEVWKWAGWGTVNTEDVLHDMRMLRDSVINRGAKEVKLYSGSYGDDDRNFVMMVEHENSEAWGKYHDVTRSFLDSEEASQIMAKSRVLPNLEWLGAGLLVEETL